MSARPPFSLVLSDLDDTFLARDKGVPAHNLAALDALAAAGARFVPCTGRAAATVPPALVAHPACSHVIACNGAVVARADGTVVRARPMSAEVVRAAFEAVADLDVTFDVFTGGRILTNARRFARALASFGLDADTAAMLRQVRTPVASATPAIIAAAGGIEKVTVYWGNADARDGIVTALAALPGIDVTSSHPRNVEFMAAGVDKGEALVWLCRHLGVAVASTVAFGDSPNDMGLLATAGRGVAVDNAVPEVRAVANELCGDCDEGGPGRWLLARLGCVRPYRATRLTR